MFSPSNNGNGTTGVYPPVYFSLANPATPARPNRYVFSLFNLCLLQFFQSRTTSEMRATIRRNVLPLGQYLCEFTGAEECENELYGPGWKWTFEVIAGEHEGRKALRVTGNEPSPRNVCGRFLAALAGKTPQDGLDLDTDNFIGRTYHVMIESCGNGDSTRIASFVPVAEAAATGNDIPF